ATASVSADGGGGGGGGTSAPLPVTNLAANSSLNSIDLSWDTPQSNVLSRFEVRCSTAQLTNTNFASATINPTASLPIPSTKQGVRVDGLSSVTTYYCGVRTVSVVGELSPIVYISATTTSGGGGGGGGGGGSSYSGGGGGSSISISGTSILINDGAEKTDRILVTLSLSAVNASEMMISNSDDFSNAKWETYTTRTQWVLTSGNGGKVVYAKFRNSSMASSPVSDSIILEIPIQQIIVIPQYRPINVSRPYTSIISISPEATYIPSEEKIVAVLTAHPGEVTKYGAHLEMDYPTDSLEFDKIEYGDGWIPEFNPTYNYDNQKDGRLIKTAAHDGFDTPIHFATVTFRVKKTGLGTLDTNSFTMLRELPEYKTGLYQTQASISVIASNVGKTRLMFANLVSLTTQDNTIAVISAFIFLFLCYIAYVISMHRSGKRKLVFPLPIKNTK
ncbi:MAG: fibronectin type III domain-containing protein, partial [Patescibacteria group bacterium]